MSKGPFTWRNGELVPLTEELRSEDLHRAKSSFIDVPGEVPPTISKQEKRRFRQHQGAGEEPFWVRGVRGIIEFFGHLHH